MKGTGTLSKTHVCSKSILSIHDFMDVIGGKWKIAIIACLCFDAMRFSDLLREVKGISGKVLSRELKDLELNQIITRTVVSTQPIAVEYALTEYGFSLKRVAEVIAQWGAAHRQRMLNNSPAESANK